MMADSVPDLDRATAARFRPEDRDNYCQTEYLRMDAARRLDDSDI
jgi:hypothetical protein